MEQTTNPIKQGAENRGMQYYCSLRFFEYVRPTPFDNSQETPVSTIILPLPIQLIDSTSAAFAQQDLGAVADILNEGVTPGAAAASLLRGGIAGVSDIIKILPQFQAVSKGPLKDALNIGENFAKRNLVNADTITTAVEQTLGRAPNPNPTVKFTGPVLRDVNYTWYFNPKNEAESNSIRTIIQRIKNFSLPSFGLGSSAILNYPHLAQVNFYPWDQPLTEKTNTTPNRWGWTTNSIIRLKRCFVTSVSVNYNPANVPAFYNDRSSNPVIYELSIQLKEVEYMTAQAWGDEDEELKDSRVGTFETGPIETVLNAFDSLKRNVTGAGPAKGELIRAIL
jgi:hypothetical protein